MSVQETRQTNATAMQKATSSDFSSGAQLTPEQFDDFMLDVREQSEVLDRARMVSVESESGDIPRLSVSSRLLQSVSEGNSATLVSNNASDIPYATTKVSLPWEQTWEANNEIIDDPEATLRGLYVDQFRNDLEILASIGDTSQTGFQAIEDGWLTIADNRVAAGQQYDHGAAAVNNTLFNELRTRMPHQYKERQNPVFLCSYAQMENYGDFLTDRSTAAGDRHLIEGNRPTPYGFDILTPLAWPDDRVMFTSMENLFWIVQRDMNMKSTDSAERNVLNDVDTIYNMLAKIDYQLQEEEGVVTASNIAAP